MPILNYRILPIDNGLYEVLIWWESDDIITNDTEYTVSVANSSYPFDPLNFVTTMNNITLILTEGAKYNISVTAQRCNGMLTSGTGMISLDLSGKRKLLE